MKEESVKDQERMRLRVLTREQTARIHDTALRVLREVGIAIGDDETRRMLKDKGCRESGDGYLLFDPDLVQESLSGIPPHMVLFNREGRIAVDTDDGIPHFGSGIGCLDVLDQASGTHRPCLLEDIIKAARVCEKLPNIDLASSLGSPHDVAPEEEALATARAMVENTSKPFTFLGHDEVESNRVWEYLANVAGGWEALSRRPFALELTGPTSPLKVGAEACRRLRSAARRCLPVVCYPGAIPGATAPMTLVGAVGQFAAESLAGMVIHQLERRGAPVLSGAGILPMDMRTGSISYGGPEYAWVCLATVDYLRDLGIPSWSGSGCSDAHTVDAQAAAEAGFNILAAALSGTALTHNLGFLSAGKTGSLEMLVLCDELAGMARRFVAKRPVDDNTLAFNVIEASGKSGSTMTSEHTLEHVRKEMWVPSLFQRSALNQWVESGSRSLGEKIREKLRTILNT